MTGRAPSCGRRVGYELTAAGCAATGGPLVPAEAPVPYRLTLGAFWALQRSADDDRVHEPRAGANPCDGRGCGCRFPGPRRDGAT